MNEDRKSPTSGDALERAAGTACGSTPYWHSITSKWNGQGICALLLHGEVNALSARELAQITNRPAREITREVERLRLNGTPICAGIHGYFLPDNTAELERYIKAFNRRLRHINATKTALDDVLTAATGQVTAWDGDAD